MSIQLCSNAGVPPPPAAQPHPGAKTKNLHEKPYLIFINLFQPESGHTERMQRLSRLFSGLIMALVLALTGPGTSIAGMATAGLTPMEICGSGDAQVVWLDANGNPVDPASHCTECPLCTAAGPVALPVRPDPAALKGGHARRLATPGPVTRTPARNRHTLAEARAPPRPARNTLDILGTFEPVIGFASLEFGQVIRARSVADRGHPMKDACR